MSKETPGITEQEKNDYPADKQVTNLNLLLERMDSTGVAQYVRLMQNTPKVLWLSFLSGVARGLGFTVGTALVLAVAYKILSGIIKMNIPFLTDMLTNLVQIIQTAVVK